MRKTSASRTARDHVVIVNPLGRALQHYTDALVATLVDLGMNVSRADIAEPCARDGGPLSWLADHVRALLQIRSSGDHGALLIVTWPVLGWLDLALARLAGVRRSVVVVHDPRPLERSAGYGRVARCVARVLGTNTTVLVHGEEAQADVAAAHLRSSIALAPHPMRLRGDGPAPSAGSGQPVVRVLGRYKGDRDVEVMAAVAAAIGHDAQLEVHGAGWPPVSGWTINDAFLPEDEFDELIATATVVLVPYRRVYQSGVAVRATELGVPFVGTDVSAHRMLHGEDSSLLVDPSLPLPGRAAAYRDAIRRTVAMDAEERRGLARAAEARTSAAWQRFLVPLGATS